MNRVEYRRRAENALFAERICRRNASKMNPGTEKDALLEEAADWREAAVRLDRAARLAK